jgi:rare lipoprotein A
VTNLSNGKSLIVRVNDRGPYHGNRVIDVSHRAATLLDFQSSGIARVRVEYVGRAPLEGSDDAQLVATLRTNEPAPPPSAVRIASAAPFVPQADPQIRGVVRRDVPLPAERPYALGNADDQTPVAEAVAPSYAGGSRAYASEADAPSAYRGAGYVSSGQNSTANPVLGRGLY